MYFTYYSLHFGIDYQADNELAFERCFFSINAINQLWEDRHVLID